LVTPIRQSVITFELAPNYKQAGYTDPPISDHFWTRAQPQGIPITSNQPETRIKGASAADLGRHQCKCSGT